jgi:hypothetical protein
MTTLGRLEQVDLRQAWISEASDFTPWLALPENLALLGEAIGLELECEAQEKNVGPFRADILCRDRNSHWVLIENQLERTDHVHLGQLLTYAAGLKAVTVVWVAQRFTDEHRAALDWLNEITNDEFKFFGLEIELWRIANSPVAPKFNVIAEPNSWSRTIKHVATSGDKELSETRLLYLEYWEALKAHLEQRGSSVRMTKPSPSNWMGFAIGRTPLFNVTSNITRQKRTGYVSLVTWGDDHVAYFRLLKRERAAIESEIGHELEWRELPDGRESHIRQNLGELDLENREDWPRQHQLFQQSLERFVACFRPRVKTLDAADFVEDAASVGALGP